VVAVQVQERNHGWGSHVIEFFAIGTAVVRDTEVQTVTPPAVVLTANA